MAFPWLAAAIIGSSLAPMIFGGGRGGTERVTEVPPTGWQDPMMGMMSPLIADMLVRRMGGFGEGSSIYSPWASKIMEMLGGEFPKILAGYGRETPSPGVVRRPQLAGGI